MTLQQLPPLRDALSAAGLLARKSFGQHFLLDLNLTRKMVRAAGSLSGQAVVEVGPGPGGLTRALLETDVEHVIAIEKDRRFLDLLHALSEAAEGRLTVVQGDALHADETALAALHAPGRPAHLVSNLPYNVGTPLLIKWLTGVFRPASMTLMFQKEVAQRLAAQPGEDAYGRLSVLAQAVCETTLVMTLPARAFTPPPKVDSAVVHLVPRPDGPSQLRVARLEEMTRLAFGQRRKMLRTSLRAVGGDQLCGLAGLNASLRAEDVSVAGFLDLADAVLSSSHRAQTLNPASGADPPPGA